MCNTILSDHIAYKESAKTEEGLIIFNKTVLWVRIKDCKREKIIYNNYSLYKNSFEKYKMWWD